MMGKIGVFGGTFNPVHNGHIQLALSAQKEYALDEVWFLPNGNPPHKMGEKIEASREQRKEMLSLAIKKYRQFRVEDYELWREEPSYSCETMEFLKKRCPDFQYYFLIGADSLFSLRNWRNPEKLCAADG